MIKVVFAEPTTADWQQWRNKAAEATAALLTSASAGRRITQNDIKDAIYKGARSYIYKAFHGKCAYCEAKFILDQSGDVDHFRPKARVTDENDRPVRVNSVDHPGYYWLAYDWQNLLPCCSKCNRPSKLASGKMIGKGTRFPVETRHAFRPEEVLAETPMFINPTAEDPAGCLEFDPFTGIIGGTNTRGRMTVELLGLNREGLPEERRRIYVSSQRLLREALDAITHDNQRNADEAVTQVKRYMDGLEPYSWPARIAIRDSRERIQTLLSLVPLE